MTKQVSSFKKEFKERTKESGTDKNWLFIEIAHKYQVTTCYRESSAIYGGWYYETFVWERTGSNAREDRKQIGQLENCNPLEVAQWVIDKGGFNQDEWDNRNENDQAS